MTESPQRAPRVAVIGIGNVLLGDDAFGPTVVELMRAHWRFPEGVELIDAGTPGLDLVDYMSDRDHVVLVDAVATRSPPGTVVVLDREAIRRLPRKQRVSPHDPVLQDAVWLTEITDDGPRELTLIGAVPQNLEPGADLSPAMLAAIRDACITLFDRLETIGCTPDPELGKPCRPWWVGNGVDLPRPGLA